MRDVGRQVVDDDRRAGDDVGPAVAEPPVGHAHGAPHERDRVALLALGERRLEAHLHQGGVLGREQVGEARLGRPRRLGRVEDEAGDELRVVEPRDVGQPVAEAERDDVARELQVHELLGLVGRLARLRHRPAARAGELVGRLARLARPLRRLAPLGGELVADLRDGLVDEGSGAVDDLHGLEASHLRAGAVGAATRRDIRRRVARQAALEGEHTEEVRGEDEPRQRLADEDDDRVVAEAVVVALGRLVGRGRATHERVRARRGPQGQRGEHGRAGREHDDRADHGGGPPRDPRHEALQNLPGHRRQASPARARSAPLRLAAMASSPADRVGGADTAPGSRRPSRSGPAGCTAGPESARRRWRT